MSKASPHRRVTATVAWAKARIAHLDRLERYEESFALTEEFREWIVCLDQHPELVESLLAPDGHGLGALDIAE